MQLSLNRSSKNFFFVFDSFTAGGKLPACGGVLLVFAFKICPENIFPYCPLEKGNPDVCFQPSIHWVFTNQAKFPPVSGAIFQLINEAEQYLSSSQLAERMFLQIILLFLNFIPWSGCQTVPGKLPEKAIGKRWEAKRTLFLKQLRLFKKGWKQRSLERFAFKKAKDAANTKKFNFLPLLPPIFPSSPSLCVYPDPSLLVLGVRVHLLLPSLLFYFSSMSLKHAPLGIYFPLSACAPISAEGHLR